MEFRNEDESIRKLKIGLQFIINEFDILMSMPQVLSDDSDDITTCLQILSGIKIRFEESHFKYLELKEDDEIDEFASFIKELNAKYCFYLRKNNLSKSSSQTSIESQLSNVSSKSIKRLNSVVESAKLHQNKMSSSETLNVLKRTKLEQMNLPSFNRVKSAKCKVCFESHEVYTCDSYLSKTLRGRYAIVSKLRLCRNCLRPGHKAINCRNEKRCKKCNKKHHTTLHFTKTIEPSEKVCSKNHQHSKFYSLKAVRNQEYQIQELSTIRILIPDAKGNWQSVEAIIDTVLNKKLLNQEVTNSQVKVVSETMFKNKSVNQQHATQVTKKSKLTNVQVTHKRRKESNDHHGSLIIINANQEQKLSSTSELNHKNLKRIDSCDTSCDTSLSSGWQIVRSLRNKRSEDQVERNSSANSTSDADSTNDHISSHVKSNERFSQSKMQNPIRQNRMVQKYCLSIRH